MKKFWLVLIAISIPLVAAAGYNQTNPTAHKHKLWDDANKSTSLQALLRVGWPGSTAYLDQVKVEIKNTGSLSFTIKKVAAVNIDGTARSTPWSENPNALVKKGETYKYNWQSQGMVSYGIFKTPNVNLQIDIDMTTNHWCLYWDPAISGSDSTELRAGTCDEDHVVTSIRETADNHL